MWEFVTDVAMKAACAACITVTPGGMFSAPGMPNKPDQCIKFDHGGFMRFERDDEGKTIVYLSEGWKRCP
jgi:hypothetical protein